ncbi:unnamed protein product [Sphagnum jensenii]|uniref:Uncharacterized protein n=1 Tax=Sphagnum jensenii TaxID=128206 RepID=A0ABP1AH25_9BRYO
MTIGIWKSGCAFLAPTRRGSSSSSSQIQDLKARIFLSVRSGGIGFFYPLFAIPSSLNMPAGAAASGGGNRFCSSVAVHAFSDAQEWTGLQAWRTGSLNEFRSWGPEGPMVDKCELAMQDSYCGGESDREHNRRLHCEEAINRVSSIPDALGQQSTIDGSILAFHRQKLSSLEMVRERNLDGKGASSLAEWGALVLGTPNPVDKAFLTHHAFRLWVDGSLPLGVSQAPDSPARPAKPELVHPRKVPQPKGTSLSPSAHALHNLAHIELNAIDLAWDTVVRFSTARRDLDDQFFADFAHVADDESRHCLWCLQRLSELGFSYGSMPAHNLLLRDCQKTTGSVTARLAVIPMMQEARGLDAGPRLVERLMGFGDARSASIAKHIAEEEVAHVAVGVSWFLSVCKQLGMNPASRFQDLMLESEVQLKGPFNYLARSTAGLPRDWYDSAYRKATVEAAAAVTTNKVAESTHNTEDGTSNVDASISNNSTTSCLPEVYKRLALVVAMENENAEL